MLMKSSIMPSIPSKWCEGAMLLVFLFLLLDATAGSSEAAVVVVVDPLVLAVCWSPLSGLLS